MYSPLWEITNQKSSVSCTPPFGKSPIKIHRFHVLPPLKTSPIKSHQFCVLPPLKNHPSTPISFVYSPLWKITHQKLSVLSTRHPNPKRATPLHHSSSLDAEGIFIACAKTGTQRTTVRVYSQKLITITTTVIDILTRPKRRHGTPAAPDPQASQKNTSWSHGLTAKRDLHPGSPSWPNVYVRLLPRKGAIGFFVSPVLHKSACLDPA